ncbi:MAG: ankyrin repeat domain-containing protein [Crocinitomix sp.]|nr:ankyrin repeat domain-containing protein [Crocinitomix sp.]
MNRKIIFIVLVIINVSSCASNQERDSNNLTQKIEEGVFDKLFNGDRTPCTEEEFAIMAALDTGNYEVVMDYLKNGGNPMLACEDERSSPLGYMANHLSTYMKSCDSMEYVKYYLTLDIPDEERNDFLQFYIMLENQEMVLYLVELGAYLPDVYNNCTDCIDFFKQAGDMGYDFNRQNPETGNTILMTMAFCFGCDEVKGQLEAIKYLISQGARLDIKNHDGQTALDLATDEKIKAYLMSFED